ncbi:thiamine pyrophosphate-dependent enzyme [Pasteurella atlantica]|uniref:thiamine pyrophosphate-dependent enzyme n=1 Tax=Pasteurellaceae TaxID=712 RepID=UPI00274FD567|nr:thiamine pyrophosphate-dependent enzyme [Pasteurella atlantica]MDP8098753.1 thiamine pyrophosphate-dependent enzyme [Pasteurella atlantica]MDP8106865.1 thiamine pyrophosphate-dependent enzyme [Pasteurella atlantica]MDP8116555.1 thiamine pyrophosphate-dependent enzyme [Pasteurella atlantica]
MLDTKKFVEGLVKKGYSHLCVVPCSFAKNLINESINNPNIEYVPSASEAVACSVAAGLKLSGKKPIVIVQSSGLTNMGSCITSLLKPYGITFPIISSWRTYKEGDSEIQHQHLATELPALVATYGYEHTILNQDDVEQSLEQIDICNDTHTVCILKKDTFSKVELEEKHKLDLSSYTKRSEFLIALNDKFKNSDVTFIGTTGNAAREMYSFMPDTQNFYMAGNMGGALSLGLGIAKADKKVMVIGGDAEFVMHMGGLTTAGRYKDEINLIYILFDNEANKSTGGQNTYQKHLDYISIAKSSGLDVFEEVVTSLDDFNSVVEKFNNEKGLKFICVKCGFDEETPRPPLKIVKVNSLV